MKYLLIFVLISSVFVSCITDEVQHLQDSVLAAMDTADDVDTFTVIRRDQLTPEQQAEIARDSQEASQIIREATTIITSGNTSESDKIANASAIVKNPDVAASFPGGQAAMDLYFRKKLVYPLVAFQNEIKGTVYISAIIESDGKIGGLNVKKGLGYGCDESALDCIRSMPNWIPAQKNGINVRTMITIPVSFGYGN